MVNFTENIIRRGCENANSDVRKLTKSTFTSEVFHSEFTPEKLEFAFFV